MMTPRIVNALSALALLSAPPAYIASFYKYGQPQYAGCVNSCQPLPSVYN